MNFKYATGKYCAMHKTTTREQQMKLSKFPSYIVFDFLLLCQIQVQFIRLLNSLFVVLGVFMPQSRKWFEKNSKIYFNKTTMNDFRKINKTQ